MPHVLTEEEVAALVQLLELDLRRVCPLCLAFVVDPLEHGDSDGAARALRRMTPEIWDDGLLDQALPAMRRLADGGVPHARDALAELERRGGRSRVARTIVRRLAVELAEALRRQSAAALN
jgi:hypothetical protein